MWWEWAIVILVVGAASAWALRRVYRALSGGGRLPCEGCSSSSRDAKESGPVTLRTDTRSDSM